MKPLVKYRGGKSNEIPNIEKHIPRYSGRYIEPFFGGGALYFHLEPKRAVINDINLKLMAFYSGVKNSYSNLRKELDEIEKIYGVNRRQFDVLKQLTPNERVEDKNEELYYQIRDMFNDLTEKKYSDALLYFFINKTAYSGMIRYNSKGEFNVPFGRYQHLNTSLVTKKHSDLLSNTDVHNTDYKDIFDIAKSDDFMFLDPPYDCIFSDYGNEEYKDGFNDECHIALAKDFKNLNCKALLVIGRTPLIEKLYENMIIDEYAKKYSVNIRNRFKSAATHILIANYTTNHKTLFSEQSIKRKELVWQE
ncbi:MAG: Dam family site-specific DNA-(adenine-N6)-methyltransferase [Bacteroidales bacterium]|jgi:DNA adenine methylase|nr:Dam family site-specific DNA-(adenine-N6)-methyltransferase [Bacteroidales bacterium]